MRGSSRPRFCTRGLSTPSQHWKASARQVPLWHGLDLWPTGFSLYRSDSFASRPRAPHLGSVSHCRHAGKSDSGSSKEAQMRPAVCPPPPHPVSSASVCNCIASGQCDLFPCRPLPCSKATLGLLICVLRVAIRWFPSPSP